jgi:hypothetical protein
LAGERGRGFFLFHVHALLCKNRLENRRPRLGLRWWLALNCCSYVKNMMSSVNSVCTLQIYCIPYLHINWAYSSGNELVQRIIITIKHARTTLA